MTFNWYFFQEPADGVLLPFAKQRLKLERVPIRRQAAPSHPTGSSRRRNYANRPVLRDGFASFLRLDGSGGRCVPRCGRTKKGRRPIAPPRLVCTLEPPVSLRIDDGQLGIQPGPASSVPVISPSRNAFRRTLASALAPDVIGPRSHGRRAQTAHSLRCSLDSPPSDGRWFVATLPLLTHLVPAQAGFTRSYQSRPQAVRFCRRTAQTPRHGREDRQAGDSNGYRAAHSPAPDRRSRYPQPHAAPRRPQGC